MQQLAQAALGELVAVLCVDAFTGCEVDAFLIDDYGLGDRTHEVHLDTALLRVPVGAVTEGIEVEIGVHFTIETRENVPVEGSGDTRRIIVSGDELFDRLVAVRGEIDTGSNMASPFS